MPDEQLMAVDTLRPIEEVDYRYPSVAACEKRGPHQVTLDHWPPKMILHDKHPCEPVQCENCGAHVIVTDPPPKSVKVIRPKEDVATSRK